MLNTAKNWHLEESHLIWQHMTAGIVTPACHVGEHVARATASGIYVGTLNFECKNVRDPQQSLKRLVYLMKLRETSSVVPMATVGGSLDHETAY